MMFYKVVVIFLMIFLPFDMYGIFKSWRHDKTVQYIDNVMQCCSLISSFIGFTGDGLVQSLP